MSSLSLKRDISPNTLVNVLYEDINKWSKQRVFSKNVDIDCFHRLYLTTENLRILDSMARLDNKLTKADESNLSIEDNEEFFSEIFEKMKRLNEKFLDTFVNPYGLDYEYCGGGHIGFIFYDYDFDYYLDKTAKGWQVYCARSSLYKDGEYIECDEP